MSTRWTKDDLYTLEERMGDLTARRAKRMFPGRSDAAIRGMIDRKRFGRHRVTRGGLYYTATDLSKVLGIDARLARLWLQDGMFPQAEKCPAWTGTTLRWRIPLHSVDDFLRTYPMLFAALPEPPEGAEDHRPVLAVARAETHWVPLVVAAKRMHTTPVKLRRQARSGQVKAMQVRGSWWVASHAHPGLHRSFS